MSNSSFRNVDDDELDPCGQKRRGVRRGQQLRPRGLTEDEAFRWLMGSAPPEEGCWDWNHALDRYGYGVFSMNGGKRRVAAHRASYRSFIGPIPEGSNVLHSCDRPICVQPKHLSTGTKAQNTLECIQRGRFPIGSRQGQAKLTEEDVRWIRSSGLTSIAMARQLGVSDATICNARNRKSWKHVS
jgi:hypothetical protein